MRNFHIVYFKIISTFTIFALFARRILKFKNIFQYRKATARPSSLEVVSFGNAGDERSEDVPSLRVFSTNRYTILPSAQILGVFVTLFRPRSPSLVRSEAL
jgi:hypothetical protein